MAKLDDLQSSTYFFLTRKMSSYFINQEIYVIKNPCRLWYEYYNQVLVFQLII